MKFHLFTPRALSVALALSVGALLPGCASKTADTAAIAPVDAKAAAAAAQTGAASDRNSDADRAASEARGKAAVEAAQQNAAS